MAEKGLALCGCFTLCFCYMWGVAILSVLIHSVNSNFAFKGTSVPVFQEIVNEWTTQPFVSIVAVRLDNSTADCPADHPDEVINDFWLG